MHWKVRTGVSLAVIEITLVAAAAANAQAVPSSAAGQPQEAVSQLNEIVVTAQKRAEAINDVPVSITAATGEQLAQLNITDVQGLVKLAPGFNAIDSGYGTPVYFLRGIGFFDSSLNAKPTVGVYQDEAPIPYSIMTAGASFDLARVEVLKGPQGTLFGSNATGGAINYISARPTDTFEYGGSFGYGRFNKTRLEGYVSGPLSETLKARLALMHEGGGAWQRSYTQDDALGDRDFTQGRLILAWKPTDSLRVDFTVNANVDKSDTQAAQLVAPFRQTAGGYFSPALLAFPLPPHDNRAADWNRSVPLRRDNSMIQATLRADYDLSDTMTFTSLTSYSTFDELYGQDSDGTSVQVANYIISGDIQSFTQEFRLSGDMLGTGNWVIGANYEKSDTSELVRQFSNEQTSFHVFDPLGLPALTEIPQQADTQYESKAVFASITAPLTSTLSLTGGVRYTETQSDFQACIINGGNGSYGRGFEIRLGLPAGTFPLNECATLNNSNRPGRFSGSLPEDNVSWRAALDWTPLEDQLFYASVSRGYKAGSYGNIPSTSFGQYAPVRQEEVTAYEAGFKSTLADHRVQLNGAVFLYDYSDKQLKGRTIVPIFGPLEALVNIPESRITGAEFQIDLAPVDGLRANLGVTWIESEVTSSFVNYTAFGIATDFNGKSFPYTPEWQLNSDVQYSKPVANGVDAFIGASYTYRTETSGDFTPDSRLDIDAYGLLDLRAGVESSDGQWRVSAYASNVFDAYYWQTATRRGDTVIRFTGMPRMYGLTVSAKFW